MSKYKLSDYIDIFINESNPKEHEALIPGKEIDQKNIPTQLFQSLSREDVKKIKSEVVKKNPKIKYYILMTLFGISTFPLIAYISALDENISQPSQPSVVELVKNDPVITSKVIKQYKITTSDEDKFQAVKKQLELESEKAKKQIKVKLIEKRKNFDLNKFYRHIEKVEGVKLVPYQDKNQITVGIGNSFLFKTKIKDLPDNWHLDFYKRIGLSEEVALKRFKANKEKYKSSKSKEALKLNKRIEKIEARHKKNIDYIKGKRKSKKGKEKEIAAYKLTIKKELDTIRRLKNIISDFNKYGNITHEDAKLGLKKEIEKFGPRSIEEFGNEFNDFDVSIKTLIYDIYFNAGMYSFKKRKIKKGKKTSYIGFGNLKKAIVAYSKTNKLLSQKEEKESIRNIISLFKKVRKRVKDSSLSKDRKDAHINNINEAINFYIKHFNLPSGLIKENTLLAVYKELI
jgi:hypothetical protein